MRPQARPGVCADGNVGSRVNTIVHTVGRRLFSRSGKQLYRIDHTLPFSLTSSKAGMGEKEHRSLLSILADPGMSTLHLPDLWSLILGVDIQYKPYWARERGRRKAK